MTLELLESKVSWLVCECLGRCQYCQRVGTMDSCRCGEQSLRRASDSIAMARSQVSSKTFCLPRVLCNLFI
jgi:hypothetical protein